LKTAAAVAEAVQSVEVAAVPNGAEEDTSLDLKYVVLKVDEILAEGKLDQAQKEAILALVDLLVKETADKLGTVTDVIRFRLLKNEWMYVPLGSKSDNEVSARHLARRTNQVAYVMERTGASATTVGKLMRRQRAIFTAAAAKARLIVNGKLGVTATLQAMQLAKTTWTGMRSLRTLLRHYGINLQLASEAKCKALLKGHEVHVSYSYMDLHSGKRKEGKSTRCLVGSSAIGEIMARDLDARLADGSFIQRKFPNDRNRHDRRWKCWARAS